MALKKLANVMISLEDCIGLCGRDEEEVAAIGEHEHIPPADAAQFKTGKCSQGRQPNARCVNGNADARGVRNPRYFGGFASAGLSAAGN
jgi:hypothetical protein